MKTISLKFIAIMSLIIFLTNCSEDSIKGDRINLNDLAKIFTGESSNSNNFGFLNYNISSLPKNSISITSTIPTKRDSLDNMRTVVKIYNGSDNVGLTIPGFGGIKLGRDETNLNVYYIETKIVKVGTDSIVYGIGYSAHFLFKKIKRGLDISNIPSIAASVQLESKKTQVFYSLQTYGIKSINILRYFKPNVNTNFDVEGYGVMQSSIDGIHNVLGDTLLLKSVKFKPEILKFVKPYDLH